MEYKVRIIGEADLKLLFDTLTPEQKESFISEKEQQHCICCLRTIIGEAVRQWYSHLDSSLMKLK